MRRLLVAIALSAALTGTALAGPFEDGLAAYERGDYATALRAYAPLAEQGDARAQSGLGWMYADGRGVTQDYAEAARWCRLAAEQGDAFGQGVLGEMYFMGQACSRITCRRTCGSIWPRHASNQTLTATAPYTIVTSPPPA